MNNLIKSKPSTLSPFGSGIESESEGLWRRETVYWLQCFHSRGAQTNDLLSLCLSLKTGGVNSP